MIPLRGALYTRAELEARLRYRKSSDEEKDF